MRSIRSGLLSLVTLLLFILGTGCSLLEQGIGTGKASLVTIEVTPAPASLAKGTTLPLTATGVYSDQTTRDLTGSVAWSSGDLAIASISNATGSAGVATGTGVGTTTITATQGAITGSAQIRVTAATLVSLGVTPAIPTIAKGTTQQFAATGIFTDASTQDLTASATWSSANTATATISNAAASRGLATGAGVGDTTITATYGGVAGSTTLTVTPATLDYITVTPGTPSIAKGTTRQFTATGTFTDASTQDLTASAAWTSSDPTTATISNDPGSRGLATGVGVNIATITAAFGTASGSTVLTVTPAALVSIAVTPASASIAKGTTRQFTAMGTFTDASTQDLTASATWSSADTATATISNAAASRGLATGAGVGDTTITAAVGEVSGSTPFSVTAATLVSIAVTPALPSFAKGTTQPLVATGTYTDSSTQDLTATVTWTSSDTSIAVISNASGSRGLATGLLVGTSTIKAATTGGVEGSTLATVCPAIVYPDTAAVMVTSVDQLVVPGMTVIVDGTALTGAHTLTWDGTAETDGAFIFKAGASTAVLTGGSGNDTFDFTAPGAVFASADHVNGGGGMNILTLGQVSGTDALANVTNVQAITFVNAAPVSITTPDALVPAGATLTVDASALSGSNTFTWNGAAETNGAFTITTGASDATVTGGAGSDSITGGAGTNTLNGGPGNDTINGGSGRNTINGGPGSDTINLGIHTGPDRINLYDLKSGADTINQFVALGANHDMIYVFIDPVLGPFFVNSDGGNIAPGDPAVTLMVTATGAMSYAGGINMIILADHARPTSAQVVTDLETGGANELSFTHFTGAQGEVLVVYSDGTNAHVVRIDIGPDSISPAQSSSAMTATDMATITGWNVTDLAAWGSSGACFHF